MATSQAGYRDRNQGMNRTKHIHQWPDVFISTLCLQDTSYELLQNSKNRIVKTQEVRKLQRRLETRHYKEEKSWNLKNSIKYSLKFLFALALFTYKGENGI